MAIYDKDKMKQKDIYPTKQTPQYSDWALFDMGKELEKKVDDLDPGESKPLEVDQPITLTESEDYRVIGLDSGKGLAVNSNGELVLSMSGCYALGFDWNSSDEKLHLRLMQILSGGSDIGVNNPSDDFITLSIINKISTDALWEQMTDESTYLPTVGQVKKRINAKQDQLYTDGLSAIEITDRAQGGKYIRADVGPIESGSMKLVRSSQIKSALDTKQDTLTFPSSGGLVKDSSNNVRVNVGDGLEMNVSGQLCVDGSIERTVRPALPLAKNSAGTLILKTGTGLVTDSNGNLNATFNINCQRVKVIGTGATGQPPTQTIAGNTTLSLDITSYVESVKPTGYTMAGQGTIFCTSISHDELIPAYFYYYNNKYWAKIRNLSENTIICNNMWIEIMFVPTG